MRQIRQGRDKITSSFFRDKIFYGWVIACSGFIISVIGIGARYSYGVFLKSIEAEFAMSRVASSSIFSVYMLLCCVVSIFGGWAMDRYGPRKVGIFMGTFTGLSLLLTSRTSSSWQLFFTYSLMLSLGTGAMYPVVNTTTSRWFVRKRGLVVGFTSSGGGVGAIIIAPVAAYLISSFDWRTSILVMGVVSWFGIAAVSLLMKKDPRDMGLLPDGGNPEPSKPELREVLNGNTGPDFSLSQAYRMRQFWLLWFCWVFLSLDVHMIFVHVVPYAVDTGISPMDAAFILSMMGMASIPGRLVVGKLSDALGRKPLGIACTLIQLVSLLWLMWAQQLWMLYAFAVVFGFMWGGYGATITALIGDIFGTRSLGSIMGIINGGWAVGAAIGPAIGGYIFDVSRSYFAAFAAGVVSLFIAAILVALIRRVPDGETQVRGI